MIAFNFFALLQQITATSLGSVVLPVVAGITVVYIVYTLFQKSQQPKIVLDTPDEEEVINSFLSSFFSGEWDAIETRIELEYFKNKVLQNNMPRLREFTTKILSSASPYALSNNREKLEILLQELEINAYVNREIATGNSEQQRQAIQWAIRANNRSALPFIEKAAQLQMGDARLESLSALIQLNEFQPTAIKNLPFQLNDNELHHLVGLYSDKVNLLHDQLNTWLIASQPQLVKFCLLLAKEYQLTVDSRTLQFLSFHQDKKLGALAMEILDGYLHQNKATESLQNFRKTTILQHKKEETTPNSNSNLAIG